MGSTLTKSCVPTAVSNKLMSIVISSTTGGNEFGFPTTAPINESLLMNDGSSFEPIATNPPGFTLSTRPAPVANEPIC